MLNFNYSIPTEVFFGENQIDVLANEIKKYGSRVLLVYGGGSVKRIGVYDRVISILKENNIYYKEISGVKPNPRISKIKEGIKILRENDLDFVLAVGGGSVIDSAKGMAAGYHYDGSPWDFCTGKAKIDKAIPIGTILTLAATGSEMNGNAVFTNEKVMRKLPTKSPFIKPRFSILDPIYTYSVSEYQTAAGTVDIISHVFEQYFSPTKGNFIQDRLAEAVLKTCIHYAPIVIEQPNNYEARANLMWASSIALNEFLGYGKVYDWAVHTIEHELSAEYDLTHGVGLAILIPNWMKHILNERTVDKFVQYANNVWDIRMDDKFKAAEMGIKRTKEFFESLPIPNKLTELGVDNSKFIKLAKNAIGFRKVGNFVNLLEEDIVRIYEESL